MNIIGRIAYFFSEIVNWFIDTWVWISDYLQNNPLLKEITNMIMYLVIGFVGFWLIKWLFNKFMGD